MFREALRGLLEKEPGFSVVGDTDDGEELPALVAQLNPDVLLMDLKLRRQSGNEALRAITATQTTVRPIMLTDSLKQGEIIHALMSGARGILSKSSVTHLLFKSIRSVMGGQYWVGHEHIVDLVVSLRSMNASVEQAAQMQTRNLSAQQQQILEAIVAGCSNRDIAEELEISERMVKYHLSKIFSKLGVSGRMELARFSLKNNIVTANE